MLLFMLGGIGAPEEVYVCFAQSANSSVGGTVEDPSGAVVPDAEVLLTNVGTGAQTTVRTNEAGRYLFPSVPAGSYMLQVAKEGFKTHFISDFKVAVAHEVTYNIVLELGSMTESVVVEAHGLRPMLETTSNELGTLIEPTSVQQLPLNGRNFLQLGLLSGATQDSGTRESDFLSAQTGHADRAITIAGHQQDMTSYLINGLAIGGSRLGQASMNLSVAAIDQFKVRHGFFLPGLGADPGVVDVVSKSGTNAFHGEIFEYVRNNVFDARNFFDPLPRPGPFRRNQFGGAAGGRIVRDRLFFFAHYEGLRQVRSATARAFAPSARMFAGDFSEILPTQIYDPLTYDPATGERQAFPGNVIPPERINPVAKKLMNYYRPGSSFADRPLNLSGNPRAISNSDQLGIRLDAALGPRDVLFGQYIYENSPAVSQGLFPLSGPAFPLTSQLAMMQWTKTLSPRLVQELRVGWTRPEVFLSGERQEGVLKEIGITGTADQSGPSGIQLVGIGSFGRSQSLIGNVDNMYQLHYALNLLQGNHEMRFGADVRYVRHVQESSNFSARGTIVFNSLFTAQLARDNNGQLVPVAGTGNSFADFLLGMPTSGTVTSMPRTHFRWTHLEAYLQDSWKIRSGFTLNLGLAWLLATPPNPAGPDKNFPHAVDLDTGEVKYAALGQIDPKVYRADLNNFAPRVGIAWQPGFSKNTVIRAGAGVYYSPQRALYQLFAITAPGVAIVQTIANNQHEPLPAYILGENVFPPIAQVPITPEFARNVGGTVFGLDTGLRTPYVQQWTFSIQRAIGEQNLVELSYVGSESRKLTNRWNANDCSVADSLACDPSAIRFPQYPYLYFAANEALANYNALVAKFQRQFTKGLSLLVNYTWSKALTNTMQGGATPPLNQRAVCRRCDKSMAGFNIPQRLVTSAVWNLPFGKGERLLSGGNRVVAHLAGGWTVNTIATFSQGNPFTITAPNLTQAVLTNFRANRICDGRRSLANTNLRRNGLYWLDPGCFGAPEPGFFGNSGANILTGPGINNWNVGIEKNIHLNGALRMQLRWEFFNAFNHAQFMNPVYNVADVNFGRVVEARQSREIQLGAKLVW